jgi:glycerol-3-phosphate dehydrogenase
MASNDDVYDLVVVGGGIVGLAILRAATLEGWRCALIERESDLLSWASGSNSGIICTGVDATPGTLERALIRDSISRIRLFCAEMNVPNRPCGSLVCHWPWDMEDRLQKVLLESHEAGDTHACYLSADQVKRMEPNLNPDCLGAIHIPGEIVVDPWLFSIAFASHARENGASIFTNFCFDAESSQYNDGVWTICRVRESTDATRNVPDKLKAKVLVNASGVWADLIDRDICNETKFTVRPRRGQYQIFSSNYQTNITHPIQPIPTQRTKGVFVFSSLYDQVIVGPTALDQDSRTDRSIDREVANELAKNGKRILRELDLSNDQIGEYAGIRPGTDRRDYQISFDYSRRWISAAGIRSTGLTASLGIGHHVARLLQSVLPEPTVLSESMETTPLPPVPLLVDEFHNRSDGSVHIGGHDYKVTHPITRFGWEARTGLAST